MAFIQPLVLSENRSHQCSVASTTFIPMPLNSVISVYQAKPYSQSSCIERCNQFLCEDSTLVSLKLIFVCFVTTIILMDYLQCIKLLLKTNADDVQNVIKRKCLNCQYLL